MKQVFTVRARASSLIIESEVEGETAFDAVTKFCQACQARDLFPEELHCTVSKAVHPAENIGSVAP